MVWFFGHKACGILSPWPGIELAPPALEGKVLTTGPPGKSQGFRVLNKLQVKVLITQSFLTLWDPVDYSPPGSSLHEILQARILERVVISSSRGTFQTQGSNPSLLHWRQILYHWATREVRWQGVFVHMGELSPLWRLGLGLWRLWGRRENFMVNTLGRVPPHQPVTSSWSEAESTSQTRSRISHVLGYFWGWPS